MKVVSDNELRVATDWGAVLFLFPNEPQDLAEDAALAAMALGAKRGEDSVAEPETQEEDEANDVSFNELVDKLVALMEEGDASKFKKDNTPKAAIVNELAGRTLSSEQRNAAWEAALRS